MLTCTALPREPKPCRRWGCSLVTWMKGQRSRDLHTPKLLEFVQPKNNKSLGVYIFEASIFGRLTLSSAFQTLHTKPWGKTEFISMKQLTLEAKMLCNPWLMEAATTERQAGKIELEHSSMLLEK